MRITQTLSDRNFLAGVETLSQNLEETSEMVSTGKKLSHLQDSPSGSAELVELRAQLSEIDQYRTNTDNGNFFVGVADSVLSSVYSLVVTIFTRGSSAASGTTNAEGRASIAREIRSLRDQVFSLANTETRGRHIFSGSKVTMPAFTIDGDKVTYQGDSEVNKISIGDGLEVQQGLAGDAVFLPIFDITSSLLTAMDSGDLQNMKAALTRFSDTLGGLNQCRGQLGIDLNRLQSVKTEQDTKEESLRARQSRVEDADLAKVITQLEQIQTALRATLTAHTVAERRTLFDFIG